VSDVEFKGEILNVLHPMFLTCFLISVVVSGSSSLCHRARGCVLAGLSRVAVVLGGLFLGVGCLICSCPTAVGCQLQSFQPSLQSMNTSYLREYTRIESGKGGYSQQYKNL
jgi:hypothetical protein